MLESSDDRTSKMIQLVNIGMSLVAIESGGARVHPQLDDHAGQSQAGSSSARSQHHSLHSGHSTGAADENAQVLLAAAISGLRYTAQVAVPLVGAAISYSYAVLLDLWLGPGRGSSVAIVTAIMWPVLAPLNHDALIVPWVGMQVAYITWTIALFAAVSMAGDAWTIGRIDLDEFPEEHRYDFFSPLGLNGIGVSLDLLGYAVFIIVAYPAIVGMDMAFVEWRNAAGRVDLRRLRDKSRREQDAIISSVIDQVPPFAQECMEAGVTAFEAKPVVMAVQLGGEVGTGPVSADSMNSSESKYNSEGTLRRSLEATQELFVCMAQSGGAGHHVPLPQPLASTQNGSGAPLQVARLRSNARLLCIGFLSRARDAYVQSFGGDAETSIAAASLGVLSKQQRQAIGRLSLIDWT